jgi:hypothetical protein
MVRRSIALALALQLGGTSSALAGSPLLASATRLAREAAATTAVSPPRAAQPAARARGGAPGAAAAPGWQGQGGGLASSGMSTKKKILIGVIAGFGFAATAYIIDHKVLDVTPSSRGTRED